MLLFRTSILKKAVLLTGILLFSLCIGPALACREEPEAVDLGNGLRLVPETAKEGSGEYSYTIEFTAPRLEGVNSYAADRFNEEVRGIREEAIENFKPGSVDEEPVLEGAPSFLNVGYTVEKAGDDVISILFKIHWYFSGAAHPNYNTRGLNFDMRTGRSLALSDLFLPGAGYLEAISDYCIEDLKERDAVLWEDGARPEAENFKSWNIREGGLFITFDPYQVNCYAAGPQEVLVPYLKLKEIIDYNGPLAPYAW